MYFPLYIDLSKRDVLVVGAGVIASRRVRTLCGFAGHITVVAPEISEEIQTLAGQYPITLLRGRLICPADTGQKTLCYFGPELFDGKALVLAATDDRGLNRQIACVCRERGIPVNVSSEKEECDFYFPSVIQKDGVVIGINASGQDHALVKRTRIELEEFLKK